MVARVAAQEPQPHRRPGLLADELPGHPHRVAQPEPEHVGVEAQRLHVVGDGHDDVAEPLLAGDERVARTA